MDRTRTSDLTIPAAGVNKKHDCAEPESEQSLTASGERTLARAGTNLTSHRRCGGTDCRHRENFTRPSLPAWSVRWTSSSPPISVPFYTVNGKQPTLANLSPCRPLGRAHRRCSRRPGNSRSLCSRIHPFSRGLTCTTLSITLPLT